MTIKPLKIDVKGLKEDILTAVGNKIVEHAAETAPVDTGYYRSQIVYDGDNAVIAQAKYSAAIEYGFENYEEEVKEHQRVIKKAFGKVLNPPVIATVKQHSRTMNRTPNPVMRNAAKQVYKEIPTLIGKVLKGRGID